MQREQLSAKPEGDHVTEGAVRVDRDQVKGQKMLFCTIHCKEVSLDGAEGKK